MDITYELHYYADNGAVWPHYYLSITLGCLQQFQRCHCSVLKICYCEIHLHGVYIS